MSVEKSTLHSVEGKLLKFLDADLEWWRFPVKVEASRIEVVIVG